MQEFTVSTRKHWELVDITDKVEEVVGNLGSKKGMCLVFVPHSTAGILLTENEKGLKEDFIKVFEKLVQGLEFEHNRIDDNADSHILSAIIGHSIAIPLEQGGFVLGNWQQIFLAEFDGPRTRKIIVQVLE